MGRNHSPLLRRELANLAKDATSRRSAMKALKSYVKDLDSKAIPHFLAQVSETKAPSSSSGDSAVSLFEVLARVHGPNIVPQIDNIMSTIMHTLSSSAGSFPLHQACSKVVPAIARYGIDPSTPGSEKTRIICCLCQPLCDALMGSQESLASGSALCLKALVESDNWRFASDEMVNEVCLRVTGAMAEKATQTNYHMSLVMALAKHNCLILEPYARSLVRYGLQILTVCVAESNSQKRLSSIQMINFLMKAVDSRSISSELGNIIVAMEKCQNDQMAFVKNAASEALETVKIATKGSKQGICSSPTMESSFYMKNDKYIWGVSYSEDASEDHCPPEFASQESQTVESFIGRETFIDSPMSVGRSSSTLECHQRANRRLWGSDFGGVDLSLKDGLFMKKCSDFDDMNGELIDMHKEKSEAFSGFVPASFTDKAARSTTPSPQRSRPQLNIDDLKILKTPRKLIRSLQDPTDATSRFPTVKSPSSTNQNPVLVPNEDHHSHDLKCKVVESRYIEKMRMLHNQNIIQDSEVISGRESVSSTSDAPAYSADKVVFGCLEDHNAVPGESTRTRYGKAAHGLACGLCLILLAVVLSATRIDNDELSFDVVPT